MFKHFEHILFNNNSMEVKEVIEDMIVRVPISVDDQAARLNDFSSLSDIKVAMGCVKRGDTIPTTAEDNVQNRYTTRILEISPSLALRRSIKIFTL